MRHENARRGDGTNELHPIDFGDLGQRRVLNGNQDVDGHRLGLLLQVGQFMQQPDAVALLFSEA